MKKHITVLVVDDELVNCKVLEALLKRQGYRILIARNGPEARELAVVESPDLVLLDIMMPGESGFTVCEKLKENPATANIPIIFISALNDTESKVKGLTLGAWDFITKPFQKEEVLARVKNYLRLNFTFKRLIEEQARRLQEIQIAQQSILVKPEDLPRANFGVSYVPIVEAGGDFYDVFEISDNILGYFVADVAGHDISAAFATSALKALVRQNSSPLYSPEETVSMINSILTSIFTEGQHLTAVYGYLDHHTSTLHIVNAAHPATLFLPVNDEPRWIPADGDIIGVFESGTYINQSLPITGGERLFFYTDGLLENFTQPCRTREQGMEELLTFALETREMEIQQATDEIVKRMFAGGRPMEDDILLLGVDV